MYFNKNYNCCKKGTFKTFVGDNRSVEDILKLAKLERIDEHKTVMKNFENLVEGTAMTDEFLTEV